MKKKKVMSLMLAMALTIGILTGCTGKTSTEPIVEEAAEEEQTKVPEQEVKTEGTEEFTYNTDVTIQIFQSKNSIIDQLEAMAAEYTELTGVKVEVLGAAGDNYQDNLVGKLTSGQGPTIFSVSEGSQLEKLNSYLYDLSDQSYISDIAEGMALQYQGKVLGVPYAVEGYGLVYNKNLTDASKITDLDEFKAAASELKEKEISLLELSDKAFFLLGHILNVPFALQDDYMTYLEQLNKGEVSMAQTPEFQEWAQFMEVIRDNSSNPMGITYDDQAADFATEKTAMIHQGNWVWLMFEDYGVEFDMSIAPLPVMGNKKISAGVPNAWVINKEKDQAEIDEALKFFNWMFTSERGKYYITEEFKFIPAMKSIEASTLDPLAVSVHEYVMNGEVLPWTYNYWPDGMLNNQLMAVAQKFFSENKMTGQQFLEELDKAWAAGVK